MSSPPPPESPSEESPRVPVFRTWRGLYFFVLGMLALYIVFLALWSRWFT
jgi:hypothetical protein